MKILLLTTPEEDYLQDNILVGMRTLLGPDLIDWPKKEAVYKTFSKPSSKMYGNGFTAWKILDDIQIDRTQIEQKIKANFFDLIVFANIRRQEMLAGQFFIKGHFFSRSKFIFIDGEDYGRLSWQALPFGKYYKRERKWMNRRFTHSIGFSIPDCKVRTDDPPKINLFAKHVQCDCAYEIDWIRQNCQKKYAFADEKSYYENIAQSYYAITMKKAGWDCMRHYEIAANGTVPAFYRLGEKPAESAPHGLIDMKNCLSFETPKELLEKIELVKKNEIYPSLQSGVKEWIAQNTCSALARRLLGDFENLLNAP